MALVALVFHQILGIHLSLALRSHRSARLFLLVLEALVVLVVLVVLALVVQLSRLYGQPASQWDAAAVPKPSL